MIDYDSLAENYARHRQVHPALLQALLAEGSLNAASTVLEVGCGTANYIIAIEQRVRCVCWGVDPSEQMLARARARVSTVTLSAARAEALDAPDGSFNLVFSVDVIHHVTDHRRYFDEAFRVLKPGGRLCTATDSEWIIRNRQPLSTYFPATIEPELRRYPSIEALRVEMRAAGFHAIRERAVEFAYPLTDSGPYRSKAYSALHLIPQEAFERGLSRLEEDLRAGPVQAVPRYTLIAAAKPG